MDFTYAHTNFNVVDLEKSAAFYKEALGLVESRRKKAADGSYELLFLTDKAGVFELELTWVASQGGKPYDLGDEEFHIAFATDDIEEARKKHEEMGCVKFVNEKMGIYFITDPDGYWIEIVRRKK